MSVYFYYLPISGLVKIGVSDDVEQRVKTLSTGCPEVGEVIHVIDDFGFKAEKWLHKHFKELKVKGEWFRYCDEMRSIQLDDSLLDYPSYLNTLPMTDRLILPKGAIVSLDPSRGRKDWIKQVVEVHKLLGLPI